MILINLLKNLTTMSLCLTLRKAELYTCMLVARRRKRFQITLYTAVLTVQHTV